MDVDVAIVHGGEKKGHYQFFMLQNATWPFSGFSGC